MSGISLGRVTTLLLLGRSAGYLLTLVNSVILARALGVDRLGAYAYAMGLAALFGLVPNLGISTILARTIARDPNVGDGVLRAALRAQAILAGGVLVAIPVFAAILPVQPIPLLYVGLAAAQLALGSLSWPYLAVLGGRARYDLLALVELTVGVSGTVLNVAAVALGGGVATFLWAQVLAVSLAIAVARRVAFPFLPTREAVIFPMRALIRQAAPFGLTAIVQSLYTRLDVLLLGQMASTVALGLYNVAYKPTNMAVYFGGTVAGAIFPLMARPPWTGTPIAFDRAMRGLGAAGPAMALTFSGLAGSLLRVLYGDEFTAAAPILILLAWSALANWLYAPLGVSLQARGQERWWLISLVGALALNAAGNLLAIPRWGAIGAAGTTLASEIALVGMGTFLVGTKLGILPSPRPVVVALGATVGGAATLWALASVGAVAATLSALIVYGSLLMLFGVVTTEDAALVIGWVRQGATGSPRG
jgi:O-antigen/teichoic acid export membrane protein